MPSGLGFFGGLWFEVCQGLGSKALCLRFRVWC